MQGLFLCRRSSDFTGPHMYDAQKHSGTAKPSNLWDEHISMRPPIMPRCGFVVRSLASFVVDHRLSLASFAVEIIPCFDACTSTSYLFFIGCKVVMDRSGPEKKTWISSVYMYFARYGGRVGTCIYINHVIYSAAQNLLISQKKNGPET